MIRSRIFSSTNAEQLAEMDLPSNFLHGYLHTFPAGNLGLSGLGQMRLVDSSSEMLTVSSSPIIPVLEAQQSHSSLYSASDGEVSLNDSGFLSTPRTQFTGMISHPRGSCFTQQETVSHVRVVPGHSPAKIYQPVPGSSSSFAIAYQPLLSYHSSPLRACSQVLPYTDSQSSTKPSSPDTMENLEDWEGHFIDNFHENLFDSVDLNNMMDSIMTSPLSSPFKSMNGVQRSPMGLSPFKNAVTSNVMLAGPKRSPARLGMSPSHNLFSSPSPVRGFASHTKTSPVTRQRRLILPSPAHKSETAVDQLSDLQDYLSSVNENGDDDLGVMPFTRTNSFGFTPQDDASASIHAERPGILMNAATGMPLQEIDQQNGIHVLPPRWSPQPTTYSSPLITNIKNVPDKSSTSGVSEGLVSITKHSQLINTLPSRETLHFMRDYFRQALEKASAEAYVEETKRTRRLHARSKKSHQSEDELQLLGNSNTAPRSSHDMQNFTNLQVPMHRSTCKRRQKILPKPSEWSDSEPSQIVAKKRRR